MLFSILVFILILSVLILVHELGHFLVAKKSGIWVEEFGFGIPPRIIGKKVGETIYSINLFPFGGFVRLHGEITEEGISKPDRAFLNKNKRTRFAVIVAGVVSNFLLAIAAFSLIYTFTGIPKPAETGQVKVVGIAQNSPASQVGLMEGDILKSVQGQGLSQADEFTERVSQFKGKEITVSIERNGEIVSYSITPRENPPSGEGPIGVAISSVDINYTFPPIWQRPFIGVYFGFKEALFWGGAVILGLGKMIANLFSGIVPKDIAGPAGLFVVTTEAQKAGFFALINLLGIISVNLAILNIFPFPALDGGRLLFLAIEGVFGKRIVPKIEAAVHATGLVILIFLILLVTIREVRLIRSLGFNGYLEYMSQGVPQ